MQHKTQKREISHELMGFFIPIFLMSCCLECFRCKHTHTHTHTHTHMHTHTKYLWSDSFKGSIQEEGDFVQVALLAQYKRQKTCTI